jgi:hypothetical protein
MKFLSTPACTLIHLSYRKQREVLIGLSYALVILSVGGAACRVTGSAPNA